MIHKLISGFEGRNHDFYTAQFDSAAISGVEWAREQVFKKIANSNIFSSSTWKKSSLFREDCMGSSS